MDFPVLVWRKQGLCECEEYQGGGGRLDLCEGSPGMGDRNISQYDSPPVAKTSITESTSRHPGHAITHWPEGAGAISSNAPLHAPNCTRGGSTPLPDPARLVTGKGRQGLSLVGISSINR